MSTAKLSVADAGLGGCSIFTKSLRVKASEEKSISLSFNLFISPVVLSSYSCSIVDRNLSVIYDMSLSERLFAVP